jgi:hypothetical protein
MSRITTYKDNRLTIVEGYDHMLGVFLQLFDNEMEDETPEGEGLVLDHSRLFGFEINRTGIPNSDGLVKIVQDYLKEHGDPEVYCNYF